MDGALTVSGGDEEPGREVVFGEDAEVSQPEELAGERMVTEDEDKVRVTWEALKVGPLGGRGRWGRKNIFCRGLQVIFWGEGCNVTWGFL